jgi:hypothetical protein
VSDYYVPQQQSDLVANFKTGDMLYGLHGDREKFRVALMKITNGFIVTIDPFNNIFLTQTLEKSGFKQENVKNAIDDLETERKIPKDYSIAYSEFLINHQRFSPKRVDKSNSFRGKDAQTARSCKAMIEFTLSRGNTVHFLLDSFLSDKSYMKSVVEKVNVKPTGFTNAELRYIYRNRNRGLFMKGIKFYLNGMLCKAPWEQDAGLWQQYVPKHEYTD